MEDNQLVPSNSHFFFFRISVYPFKQGVKSNFSIYFTDIFICLSNFFLLLDNGETIMNGDSKTSVYW